MENVIKNSTGDSKWRFTKAKTRKFDRNYSETEICQCKSNIKKEIIDGVEWNRIVRD